MNANKPLLGAFIGAIVGLPVSYYFQSELIRAKVSLPQYLEAVFTEWNELGQYDAQSPVIFGIVLCAIIGGVVGAILGRRSSD